MREYLRDNERLDDLQYKGLKIIQKKDGFCFGVDAVLLSNFAGVRKGARVIDIGTGTGIIAILLAAKTQAREVVGIDIQRDVADMAARSVRLNNLEEKVKILCCDVKNAAREFGPASFDYVVCNPPYMAANAGLVNPNDAKAISRHEIKCSLEDIIAASAEILVPGGKIAVIYRPHRFADMIYLMRRGGLEPKKVRFVHPSPSKKCTMVLVEASKGERPNMTILSPLCIRDETGEYSREIEEIYGKA